MSHDILLLVDGTGVAYRAFHAIPSLTTRDGRPTNAVYGFIKMLHQLRDHWRPTHWAVVFDGGLPPSRLEKLPTYKAQRPPMPDALRRQFEPLEEFLRRSGIRSIRLDQQEADDVIATLAVRGAEPAREVIIASSDKDLYQLVREDITMVSPAKSAARIGPAEVVEKTGVPPARVAEWLALTGDSVDNIPGVPGVGPKTAARLLETFGSLEELWRRLAEVQPASLRQNLEAARAVVERNLEVVRLRTDVPVPEDWESLRVRRPDVARLLPFYREMEFHTLERALEDEAGRGPMLDFGDSS